MKGLIELRDKKYTPYYYNDLIQYLLEEQISLVTKKRTYYTLQEARYRFLLNQPFMKHFSTVKISVSGWKHG